MKEMTPAEISKKASEITNFCIMCDDRGYYIWIDDPQSDDIILAPEGATLEGVLESVKNTFGDCDGWKVSTQA